MKKLQNYAFIDGNNLYLGVKTQNIQLDYRKLRFYLRDKLEVEKAFIFIGYDQSQTALYSALQSYGFILIFKPTVIYRDPTGHKQMKGNVDAELVLHASAIEYSNYKRAVIISSDGDFACLVRFLSENNKLSKLITPTEHYSKLLRPFSKYILPLKTIKPNIEHTGKKSDKALKNRHLRSAETLS